MSASGSKIHTNGESSNINHSNIKPIKAERLLLRLKVKHSLPKGKITKTLCEATFGE